MYLGLNIGWPVPLEIGLPHFSFQPGRGTESESVRETADLDRCEFFPKNQRSVARSSTYVVEFGSDQTILEDNGMGSTIGIAPSASVGRILLVSNDPVTVQQFTEVTQQLALHVEVCLDVPTALRLLSSQKFEAVVVDLLLGEAAQAILVEVRVSHSNRTAVTFTVSGSLAGTADAFKAGSSFVLERPLTHSSITRTLKAAYGLIVRERRRYFRCPVAVPADIGRPGLQKVHGQTVNISEGGMALTVPVVLKPSILIAVHFRLPNRPFRFEAQAFICWSNEQGRAGVEFASPSGQWKSELQEWLLERLEDSLPESVAEKFRRGVAPEGPAESARN
jgi:ActR/RegA family two-component response regulator